MLCLTYAVKQQCLTLLLKQRLPKTKHCESFVQGKAVYAVNEADALSACSIHVGRHFLLSHPIAQCLCISGDCSIPSLSARPAVCDTLPRCPRASTAAWMQSAARRLSLN